jgi:Spy/CpxP family protein refolding chaperone
MGPGGGQNVIGIVLHELDLTDAQRQQVQEIAAESKTKLESARSAVRKAQKALDDAVINDGNEAAIRSAATALGTAQGDEAVLRAQTLIKIKAVLTSDQVAELKNYWQSLCRLARANAVKMVNQMDLLKGRRNSERER